MSEIVSWGLKESESRVVDAMALYLSNAAKRTVGKREALSVLRRLQGFKYPVIQDGDVTYMGTKIYNTPQDLLAKSYNVNLWDLCIATMQ